MPDPLRHHEPHHTRLFLFFTISRNLLKFMSVESVMLPNHLILCCPPSPAALNLFSIRAFSSEPALRIRWPKYWGLDLLAVQGRLTCWETRPISLMYGLPAQTSLVNPVSASVCLTHIVDFKNVSEVLIH